MVVSPNYHQGELMNTEKFPLIVQALINGAPRGGPPLNWDDKRTVDQYFLQCIVDYQVKTERAAKQVKRFIEEELGDPDDLWGTIAASTERQWISKFRLYKLHRFPQAHKRVWRIAKDLVQQYGGDPRRLWRGKTSQEVRYHFRALRLGDQISEMVLRDLIDNGQIQGTADVKADSHVRRVLGRIVGSALSPAEAVALARQMHPANPCELDWPLWWLGKSGPCSISAPRCDSCYMRVHCTYGAGASQG